MKDDQFPALAKSVGDLCAAWAYLEMVTEATLWGLLEIDERLAPLVTWNRDMESRGKIIVEHGSQKFPQEEEALKKINSNLRTTIQDRNIVIHGLIHKSETRPTCWTIYRGAGKGKNYPVSVKAVEIIKGNVLKIADALRDFNGRRGYTKANPIIDKVEGGDWPKPI